MRFRILTLLFLLTATSLLAVQAYEPYKAGKVDQSKVDKALQTARSAKKFLMVEFGANWCEDCIVLSRTLETGATKDYFEKHFVVLKVDVDKFDKNLEIAKALGVEMNAIDRKSTRLNSSHRT